MTGHEIIRLVFGVLLGLDGTVLLLLAFTIGYPYLVQQRRCTARTAGRVVGYTAASRGGAGSAVHLPVVAYTVQGREYRAVGPQYRAFITRTHSGPTAQNSARFCAREDVFVVEQTRNSFAGVSRNPMAELYPLHSTLEVRYDPARPRLAYVLRYCNKKWVFWLLLGAGLLLWVIDVLILILL